MIIEIKIPQIGESITEVELARWLINEGDYVEKSQEIAEIDSDKATVTISAEEQGVISFIKKEGDSLKIGDVIGKIDTGAEKPAEKESKKPDEKSSHETKEQERPVNKEPEKSDAETPEKKAKQTGVTISPQAKKLIDELNIPMPDLHGSRITKKDILAAISGHFHSKQESGEYDFDAKPPAEESREEEEVKMSTLRRKISERLVSVKNETAMLTTFNEVDMSKIIDIRKKYKNAFLEKYGVKLGFMSFFVKAVTKAIEEFPMVNGRIKENNIIVPKYADIGIAVSTPKGLMVPVIRNAESKSLAEIENIISDLAGKARENKISIDDLSGGTFSITNGGVFGSLLATPIINPPQSAILGMHNIVERPVAENGNVVIRPMMYVALSYDHRIIDGRESVSFLVKVKESLENPGKLISHDYE